MKKAIAVTIVCCSVLIVSGLFFKKKKDAEKASIHGMYQFVKLPNNIIARSGKAEISLNDVLDPYYASLIDKKTEVEIALAWKQMIALNPKAKNITFSQKPKAHSFEQICGLYALKCSLEQKVIFDNTLKEFATADGELFTKDKINTNNLELQAVNTQIINHLIKKIETQLTQPFIFEDARASKLESQEFLKTVIYKNINIDKTAKEKVADQEKALGRNFAAEEHEQYYKLEQDLLKQTLEFDYVKDKHLKLPIQVSLVKPKLNIDLNWNWIPHVGKSKSPIRVIIVSDFLSEASKNIIHNLPNLSKRWPNVVFGHRPFFNKSDNYQRMYAEVSQCVWNMHSNKYWIFLNELTKIKKENFENDLYELIAKENMNEKEVKKCFLERKFKHIIDYHLKWAEHYGITSGPISFIQDEVYIGPIDEYTLRRVLQRQ